MVHKAEVDNLKAETYEDLALDTDRQVHVDGEGDLSIVGGIDNIAQSIAIHAGRVLRPLVGDPVTGERFERIRSELERVIKNDVQIDDVTSVGIDTIDKQDNSVKISIKTSLDNDYTIPVSV